MRNKAPAADQGRHGGKRRGRADRGSPYYVDVGKRLRILREECELTQGQIAEDAGMDRTSWCKHEKAEALIPIYNALSVCRHFDVSMDYIYRGLLTGVRADLAFRLAERDPALVRETNRLAHKSALAGL